MTEELSGSLLEALVVGEFVARQLGINENNLLKLLATAGGVSATILAGRRGTDYVVNLRMVGGHILVKNFRLTTSHAASIIRRSDHSWAVASANYIEKVKSTYNGEVQKRLADREPVLEARIRGEYSLKPAAVFHRRYSQKQLDDFRRRFNFYSRIIASKDFDKFLWKEKTWLKALLLYKIVEGVDDLEEFSVLPLIESISGVRIKDIKSPRIYTNVSAARQVACYAFRNLGVTALSYSKVASILGDKNHASVIIACRNVRKKLEKNAKLLQDIMDAYLIEETDKETTSQGTADGLPFNYIFRGQLRVATSDAGIKSRKKYQPPDGRINQALALVERLINIENLTADNFFETACRIAGTYPNEVRYGNSSTSSLAVKRAVSYIGKERFGMDFADIAEMLCYESESSPQYHCFLLRKQFSKKNTKT